ncbi:n-acetylglutamate synthase [Persicitalea sp.]|uniref:n-acetylglutamate synthase n=1 Tax=Persicitalea sp. TaxID=3100273 RepID=UPI003593BDB6
MLNYHDKKFRPVQNTENGETSPETIFLYQQEGRILTSNYSGGKIKSGHLIGLVDEEGNIDMRYHQVNEAGELMTGICRSRPEILPSGKIRLHETWRWTSGDGSAGASVIEEI